MFSIAAKLMDMMERKQYPRRLGVLLAIITAFTLLVSGVSWPAVGAVLLVWLSSLWLSTARQPERAAPIAQSPFSKDNLRAILELSASPLVLTEKGTVVIANRAARDVIGNHTLGQDARIAFRSPEAIKLLNHRTGGSCVVRNFVRLRDCWQVRREVIDAELAIIELTDRTAEAVVSRVHTDFVANASHELRTPLASIIGYVETLRESDDAMPTETADRFLSTIQREAKRLQDLVSDLMSLSRIEAEKHDAPETSVVLAGIAERAAHDAAGADRLHRLQLELDNSLIVPGDPQQLEQVVRNLVDNALKYGTDHEPVRVSLTRAGLDHARLSVVDRGPGVAREHLPHLTRRFYRTDPGRSRMSGGTGLGLAIVKHIVDRHRGRLDIASTLGKGTRVTVRLPLKTDSDPEEVDALDAAEATLLDKQSA